MTATAGGGARDAERGGPRGNAPTLVQRVHIDSDPGLDDLLAIALALASPELRVEGITTVAGNVSLEAVTDNARRFLHLVGIELPIGRGADGPLALSPVRAEHVHGADGRGGVALPEAAAGATLSAAQVLRRSLFERRVESVIALGPLTNLAGLLREDPEAFDGVEICWMGGTLSAGNVMPLAEFNCYSDPEAVRVVLGRAPHVRVVGLDVTAHVALRERDLGVRPFGEAPLGRALERCLLALMEVERPLRGEPAALLHDPCAVAAVVSPDLFRWEKKTLEVTVEEGRERGRLRERSGLGGPGVLYAVEARSSEIVRLLCERLAALARGA